MNNNTRDNSINTACAKPTNALGQAELEAISERWLEAAEVATLNLTIPVPPEHSEVKLAHSDPSSSDNVISIKEVELSFFLTGFGREYATPDDVPWIRIAIECDPKSVRYHEGLQRGMSAAVSAVVGKSINLEIDPIQIIDEDFTDLRCSDFESDWHLADYILENHGFAKLVVK